jgi:hypothetical protein
MASVVELGSITWRASTEYENRLSSNSRIRLALVLPESSLSEVLSLYFSQVCRVRTSHLLFHSYDLLSKLYARDLMLEIPLLTLNALVSG